MEIKLIYKTARSVTAELVDGGIYETEEAFDVLLNGKPVSTQKKIIFSLYGLKPGTVYELQLKQGEAVSNKLAFVTETEFVTLNVRDFGAKGDGLSDDTTPIQAAIACCPKNSRVYIPRGVYKITTLFLKSDLILEIGKNAILAAETDPERFPVLPGIIESYDERDDYNLGSWEGNPLNAFASIITGIYVSNVHIIGQGTIDGQAGFDNWWQNTGDRNGVYRPRMIFLNSCSNITVQGITVQNSPAWNIHPYFSDNLRFLDIRVLGPANSHNTDGIDPESCNHVEIAGVYISVGDDCIAVKSGKIHMGRKFKTPSQNILIRQCCMEAGHGSVTLGSEIGAGVKNLEVRDCLFLGTDRGLRVKTRRGRGQDCVLDEIVFRNIKMDGVKVPFVVNSFYFCDPDGKSDYVSSKEPLPVDERTPKIKALRFYDIECRNAHFAAAYIYGLPEQMIETIQMKNVAVSFAKEAETGMAAMMIGCEPSCRQGIFIQNVADVQMENVRVEGY